MKRIALILSMALVACVASAKPKSIPIKIELGGATGSTNTSEKAVGWVEEIQVSVSDGVSTGSVVVSVQPADSTVAAYNIATNSVIDEKRWRPMVDGTDIAGADLTSDPPGKFYLIGDTVSFVVSGSPTNVTWTCRIKTSE